MKLRFCLACMLVCIMGSLAHAESNALIITLTSGNKVSYPVTDQLTINVADGKFTIESANVTYAFNDIKKYTFEGSSGITAVKPNATTVTAYPNPVADVLTVTFGDTNAKIEVIGLNGAAVIAPTLYANGSAQVDLQGLPSGTYILKIGNETIKILKR